MARFRFRNVASAALITSLGVLWACSGSEAVEEVDLMEEVPDELINPPIPESKGPLSFAAGCESGPHMVLTGLGDVLLHAPLQKQARARDDDPSNDNYGPLWAGTRKLVQAADLAYANFEGPAYAARPGSSYPAFNYAPTLIPALADLGVDVVSTANNHALDQGFGGVKATIEAMEKYGMPYTGTARGGDVSQYDWHTETVTRKGDAEFRVAWLACSFAGNTLGGATNWIPDKNQVVLNCERDKSFVLSRISALASSYDAVVVTPHWGVEYDLTARPAQVQMAQAFVDAGARVVLGNHPHVPQSWAKLHSKKDGREAMVVYSMGNFISNQLPGVVKSPYTWRTFAAHVGLTRTQSGLTEIAGVRFTPLYARKRDGVISVVPALDEASFDARAQQVLDTTDAMYSRAHRVPTTPSEIKGRWSGDAFGCP